MTKDSFDDGKAFPAVMKQVANRVRTVSGGEAYDDKEVRDLIKKKEGRSLVPPPKNPICHGTDRDRDRAILDMHIFGSDKTAKLFWERGKLTGYS